MTSSQDIRSRREGMVIIKPLKVLVCLAIILTFTGNPAGWGYNGSDVSGGIQGDALSADPVVQPSRQYRSPAKPVIRSQSTEPAVHRSVRAQTVQAPPAYSSRYAVFSPTAQLSTAASILSARTPGIWPVSTGSSIWAAFLRNPPVPAQDWL